jgi:hypothetical protein
MKRILTGLFVTVATCGLVVSCAQTPKLLSKEAQYLDVATNVVGKVSTYALPYVPSPYAPIADGAVALVAAFLGALGAKVHSALNGGPSKAVAAVAATGSPPPKT